MAERDIKSCCQQPGVPVGQQHLLTVRVTMSLWLEDKWISPGNMVYRRIILFEWKNIKEIRRITANINPLKLKVDVS